MLPTVLHHAVQFADSTSKDPVNGAQLAGSWAVRETFVAVMTTNMPMVVPQLKHWFTSAVGSIPSLRSSRKSDRNPTGFRTFGGGQAQSWRGRGPPTANPIPNVTFSESEERMMNGEVRMQDLNEWSGVENGNQAKKSHIHKQVDVIVTRETERQGVRGQKIGVPSGSQLSNT